MTDLLKLEETVTFALRKLYLQYGYTQFRMSKFEEYDLYMKNKEFLVSDGVVTFTNTDGTLMALKPDVTLSIVKNYRDDQMPVHKVCYNEHVYRIVGTERSYREIMQSGLECIGDVGTYELCEVIMLALRSLQAISDSFMLDLSHLGLLDNLFGRLELTEDQIAQVMRCFAEKNEDELKRLVHPCKAEILLQLMQIDDPIFSAIQKLEKLADTESLAEIRQLALFLQDLRLEDKVHLDFSIVNDLNYYNGMVFCGYVDGIPTSILSGGQYDKLMEKMGKHAKAVGFAVYLDELQALDRNSRLFDVDQVLQYDPSQNPADLIRAVEGLDASKTLVVKSIPPNLRYRRLLKLMDGRLIEIENHG